MKIYTRTGDKGMTSLLTGKRVLKSDIKVESYGTIDELNSSIGVALSFLPKSKFKILIKELHQIQSDLFEIGSNLASPETTPLPFLNDRVLSFEKLIDALSEMLPPLKNFILPGGSKQAALFHVCRTLTRRAERRLVALAQVENIDSAYIIYLNRLSDLFFVIARYINHANNTVEIKWVKKQSGNKDSGLS